MCLEVHEPHMFLSRTLKGASVSLYKKMTHEMLIYQYIYMYFANKKLKVHKIPDTIFYQKTTKHL